MKSFYILTIQLLALTFGLCNGPAWANYSTQKALVELNDPKSQRNPVKSVDARHWRAIDVKAKIKAMPGQDISIVCEGAFPAGYIATDLLRPNGEFHRDFSVGAKTTVMDLCNQQEDRMRRTSPKLFK